MGQQAISGVRAGTVDTAPPATGRAHGARRGNALHRLLAAGAVLATPAFAQSVPPSAAPTPAPAVPIAGAPPQVAADPPTGQLAEIIVTAQRVVSNVQRVPIAIQAVTGDTLLKAGIQDTRDLQRFVPGLYAAPTGPSGSSFYIRGVGAINEAPSSDSGVAISIDQMFFSRAYGPDLALYDLERVEVLKGPQGTLYGRNATAGSINIISRKPRLNLTEGDFSAELGSYRALKVNGGYTFPLGPTLAVRAAFQVNRHDGYMKDGYDDANSKSARLHLLWQPDPNISVLLTGEYLNNDNNGPGIVSFSNHQFLTDDPYAGGGSPASRAFVLARNPGPNVGLPATVAYPAGSCLPGCLPANFAPTTNPGPYQVDANGFNKVDVKSVRGDLEWNLGFGTMSIIPTLLYTNFENKFFKGPTPVYNISDVDQQSVEARIASPGTGRFNWIAGLFYFHEQQSFTTFNGSTGASAVTYGFTPDFRTISKAAFAQISYTLFDSLKVTGGIRRTNDDKRARNQVAGSVNYVPGPPPTESAIPLISDHSKATTYRVGLDWQATPRNLIYGYVATGYHAGGFNPGTLATRRLCTPPSSGATPADFLGCDVTNEYKPEHLTAFAIGAKNRFFDNRLQFNIEAYYWRYKDLQFAHLGLVNPSASALRVDNAGDAKIKGVDAEIGWQITRDDLATVSVNYNDSHYGSLIYYNVIFGRSVTTINLQNKQFYNSPKIVTSFALQHTFHLDNSGTIVPVVNGKYQSKMIFGYLPAGQTVDVYQGAYAKVDLSLTYNFPGNRASVGAFVRNVGDKAVATGSGGNTPGTASPWVSLAPPRTFGAELRTRF